MDNQYDWFIASQKMIPEKSITAKNPITEETKQKINDIAVFFTELTESSPYKDLCNKYDEFNNYIAQLNKNSISRSPKREEVQEIYSKFDNLLSTLRAFDDRTKHILSRRYGKDSSPFVIFKEALTYEFDNVFAYRFCYQLRNYSQHAGSPISNIEVNSRLENEIPVCFIEINFDSKILVEKYNKWQSRVMKELQQINGIIPLEKILNNLMLSCSRAFSKYLISQEVKIMSSISELKSIMGDFNENEYPIIIGINPKVKKTKKLDSLQIQHSKIELIPVLENALKQAHTSLRV